MLPVQRLVIWTQPRNTALLVSSPSLVAAWYLGIDSDRMCLCLLLAISSCPAFHSVITHLPWGRVTARLKVSSDCILSYLLCDTYVTIRRTYTWIRCMSPLSVIAGLSIFHSDMMQPSFMVFDVIWHPQQHCDIVWIKKWLLFGLLDKR